MGVSKISHLAVKVVLTRQPICATLLVALLVASLVSCVFLCSCKQRRATTPKNTVTERGSKQVLQIQSNVKQRSKNYT